MACQVKRTKYLRPEALTGKALELRRNATIEAHTDYFLRLETGGLLCNLNGFPIPLDPSAALEWLQYYRDGSAGYFPASWACDSTLFGEYKHKNPIRPYMRATLLETATREPIERAFDDSRDVFELLMRYRLKLKPSSVYVLGAGARGVNEYKRIPQGAIVFSCNSAVMAMNRPPTLAFMFDKRCDAQSWWSKALAVKTAFAYSSYLAARLPCDWYFRFTPHLFEPPYSCLISGRLRGGCNCAGIAMQAAYWTGATEIILCGVEMLDLNHFDGSAEGVADASGLWPQIGNMNILIRELEKLGCEIWSMNDTALDIDVRKG